MVGIIKCGIIEFPEKNHVLFINEDLEMCSWP